MANTNYQCDCIYAIFDCVWGDYKCEIYQHRIDPNVCTGCAHKKKGVPKEAKQHE